MEGVWEATNINMDKVIEAALNLCREELTRGGIIDGKGYDSRKSCKSDF